MRPKRPILYLRRKLDAFLRCWRAREDHLPLMLKGARQVVKTETVRHFAETAYTDYIELIFVERPEFKEIVRDGVGFANGILTLPQWCAFKLPEIIRDFRPELSMMVQRGGDNVPR